MADPVDVSIEGTEEVGTRVGSLPDWESEGMGRTRILTYTVVSGRWGSPPEAAPDFGIEIVIIST
jgi:hypothetical protein